jgi:hypothetical protein
MVFDSENLGVLRVGRVTGIRIHDGLHVVQVLLEQIASRAR